MKILVTGSSGYIGNKLVHALAERGNNVHAFDISSSADHLLKHPSIRIFKGDILDKESLTNAMEGCEQVYHTAGMVKLWAKVPDTFYRLHIGGTRNVLETALHLRVNKLVHTSSCGVWTPCNEYVHSENDPNISSFNNDYDLSKFLAEKIVREYSGKGLKTVIVNLSRVYGPGQNRSSNGVGRFISQLLNNKIAPLPWRLETKTNYTFIGDVINGHIMAMEKGLSGERYILGGENISYKKFVETVKKITNVKNIFVRIPTAILKFWGRLELMRNFLNDHEPLVTPNIVARFEIDKMMDSSKAMKELGYTITPFEEGMRITIDHLKTNKYVQLR